VTRTVGRTPAAVADELLAADRALARAAASRPLRDGLGAQFADGVLMPGVRGTLVTGKAAVLAALTAGADSAARVTWTPIRVGLAADGAHGFTIGFLQARRPDGTTAWYKYLSYWTHDGRAWRVAGWRRRAMESVPIDSTMLPPLLPARLVAPVSDAATRARHTAGLRAAEQHFSDTAQVMGVGAAFALLGTPESVNVGPANAGRFTVGAAAIARVVSGDAALDAPSTLTWGADTALVASSDDLGITFGVIRLKARPAGEAGTGASFLTIWRRAAPGAPWRYVAE